MDLYAELVQRALYPLWEGGVRRRPTLRLLAHLGRTETRPLEELEALQLGALRRLLHHAYDHVPFYRERLDAAGVRPRDLRSFADLQRVPILDRPTARRAAKTRASTAAPLPTIAKATSGSSGEPLAFGYDQGSEHWRQATRLRGYGWAGYRVGVKTVHFWGGGATVPWMKRTKIAVDRALRRERFFDCNARGDRELAAVVKALRADPPRVLVCYAQAAADLARFVNANRARAWPDISVICGAERLLPTDRVAISLAFGERVFETYGSREVMLIASECEAHDGLHVSMENLVVELVVREGARERPAAEGETGEVVVTDLHNYGMPFVRYATGDLAVSRGRKPCACGRTLARIGPVEGRVTETLVDGEGGRVSGLLVAVAMTWHGQAVRAFQVVQRRDRSVTVRVVCDAFDEGVERPLRALIAPYLRGLPLSFERVAELPLDPSGKRRQVVVES